MLRNEASQKVAVTDPSFLLMTSIFKRLTNNFFFAKNDFSHEGTKPQRKKALLFFILSALVSLWQDFFRSEAENFFSYCHLQRA